MVSNGADSCREILSSTRQNFSAICRETGLTSGHLDTKHPATNPEVMFSLDNAKETSCSTSVLVTSPTLKELGSVSSSTRSISSRIGAIMQRATSRVEQEEDISSVSNAVRPPLLPHPGSGSLGLPLAGQLSLHQCPRSFSSPR
ncbi:unnamed protein product [Protopolystoma xenopodis]|uniref:Uncharacterized protein n=1 Tax=Protopolystoma xenopodis TaxID=117903 RepID=A0A448WU94_9PLAT|nr:unnamed protein product [Protopolystoma xenopodis]